MSQYSPEDIAQKIAKLVREAQTAPSSLETSIAELSARLDKLESDRSMPHVAAQLEHPSQQKFAVAEAMADEIFAGLQTEKACTFETNKPCDHCSMCNSRGF